MRLTEGYLPPRDLTRVPVGYFSFKGRSSSSSAQFSEHGGDNSTLGSSVRPNRCAITRQPTELLWRKLEPSLLHQAGWKARKHPAAAKYFFSTFLFIGEASRISKHASAPTQRHLGRPDCFDDGKFASFPASDIGGFSVRQREPCANIGSD